MSRTQELFDVAIANDRALRERILKVGLAGLEAVGGLTARLVQRALSERSKCSARVPVLTPEQKMRGRAAC